MNNKGVTLVELLIVIVVLGIISAFAIPAVGTIISNAEESSVYNDALMVENAARLWCQDNYETCSNMADDTDVAWAETDGNFSEYVDGISVGSADTDDYNSVTITKQGDDWEVTMEADAGDLEWPTNIPSESDKSDVITAS